MRLVFYQTVNLSLLKEIGGMLMPGVENTTNRVEPVRGYIEDIV